VNENRLQIYAAVTILNGLHDVGIGLPMGLLKQSLKNLSKCKPFTDTMALLRNLAYSYSCVDGANPCIRLYLGECMLVPNSYTAIITLYYEIAAISAFRCVFHGVLICGCSFYFNQSIWRAMQRNCLAAQYHNELSVKSQVARLLALPYVPKEYVTCVQKYQI
jgi:hypothetical protein